MKLKTLIVDDEHAARKELRHHLEKCENIEVIGEATNTIEAHHIVNALEYDLLILDINLPGGSAFKLIEEIQHLPKRPYIVFVTGHEHFAADAFGVDAIDYIMKPVDPKRLKKALNKVLHIAALGKPETKEKPASRNVGLIPVDIKDKTLLIPEQEILFFYAQDDYTFLKTQSAKYITKFTLKELEERVSKDNFNRCHRSYLVNLKRVKEVLPQANGTLILKVNDKENSEVAVSRAQAKKMRELLGL